MNDSTMTFYVLLVLVVFVLIVLMKAIKIVPQKQVKIIERLGKYHRTAEAGLNTIFPFLDSVRETIDLREQITKIEPQPVITRDNVTVRVNAVSPWNRSTTFSSSTRRRRGRRARALCSSSTACTGAAGIFDPGCTPPRMRGGTPGPSTFADTMAAARSSISAGSRCSTTSRTSTTACALFARPS